MSKVLGQAEAEAESEEQRAATDDEDEFADHEVEPFVDRSVEESLSLGDLEIDDAIFGWERQSDESADSDSDSDEEVKEAWEEISI
jgi:hypothetical protein